MIKDIIARGIGFNPGSIKFIVTGGFISGTGPSEALIAKYGVVLANTTSPILPASAEYTIKLLKS